MKRPINHDHGDADDDPKSNMSNATRLLRETVPSCCLPSVVVVDVVVVVVVVGRQTVVGGRGASENPQSSG